MEWATSHQHTNIPFFEEASSKLHRYGVTSLCKICYQHWSSYYGATRSKNTTPSSIDGRIFWFPVDSVGFSDQLVPTAQASDPPAEDLTLIDEIRPIELFSGTSKVVTFQFQVQGLHDDSDCNFVRLLEVAG